MRRAKIFAAVIYATLVMGTMTFVHYPDLQADEAEARISAQQAKAAALEVAPGTVKESELENEHGRLIYSFEIARPGEGGITEVNVNAMDGSIGGVHRKHAGRQPKSEQFENTGAEAALPADNV